MPDQNVLRFQSQNPAGGALPRWPDIPAASLESGKPVQAGIAFFEQPEIGLSAGIWECTAFTGRMEPYPVDEFMILLEGEVTILESGGRSTTVRAGESFVLPRGLECQWAQKGTVRKYFVIHDAPGNPPKAITPLRAIKLAHDFVPREVTPSPAPGILNGPVPVQHGRDFYVDPSGRFQIGFWDTSNYHRKIVPFPRYELMHLLEGAVSITHQDGSTQKFSAGDTFFVPMGTKADFKVEGEYLRKIYAIFAPVQ